MSDKTHAEIVAECYHNTAATQYVRKLLDRLDAAHKREVQNALDAGGFVEASRKNKQVGNSAALRVAVKDAYDKLLLWNYTDGDTARMALGVMNKLDAALAASTSSTRPTTTCSSAATARSSSRQSRARGRRSEHGEQIPHIRNGLLGHWRMAGNADCKSTALTAQGATRPTTAALSLAKKTTTIAIHRAT